MLETKGMVVAIIAFLFLALGLYSKNGNPIFIIVGNTKRRLVNISYFVIFVFFWMFGVCVTDSYDIGNYKWAYLNRLSHGKEPFFDAIQFFFHDAGWSFETFKFVWFSLVVILLYSGIKKYSKTPGAVIGLALITVMTGFITQMRSALVGAIFLNAFQLILSEKRKDRILYLIIILLSAQIHIIGYCFLLFFVVNPKENKNIKKIYYFIIVLITLIALFGSSFSVSAMYRILNLILTNENSETRVLSYFSGEGSHFRYASFLIIKHFMLFLLTDKACEAQIKERNIDESEIRRLQMIREANTLMLIFLPVTILAASFERLFNCFALIQYSMVFNVGKENVVLLKKYSLNISLQFIMVVGILLITFVEWYFSPEDVIRMLNSLEWMF